MFLSLIFTRRLVADVQALTAWRPCTYSSRRRLARTWQTVACAVGTVASILIFCATAALSESIGLFSLLGLPLSMACMAFSTFAHRHIRGGTIARHYALKITRFLSQGGSK